jgi:hypothetical protein
MTDADRDLADLLPWLTNGTLAGAERSAVEGLLARSPDAAKELRLWKAVQAEVEREQIDAGVELGWRRFEKQLKRAQVSSGARQWRIAAAIAALAIVGLQSTILWRMDDADIVQLEAPSIVRAGEWHVQMRFRDDATAAQIGDLLAQAEARIVNGPSALGLYDIAVTRSSRFADASAAAAWLRAQPIVEESVLPPVDDDAPPP